MDYDDLKRQPVTRLGSTATILIGLGLMLVGYFLLFVIGGSSLRLGEASEQWPTVDGVVISSGLAGGAFRGEDDRSYTPEITYRYELEGDTYKSDRINFRVGGFNLPSRSAFREYIDKYPEGERISVYYDPKNPEVSCLEPGLDQGGSGLLGLIALVIGGIVFVSGGVAHIKKRLAK